MKCSVCDGKFDGGRDEILAHFIEKHPGVVINLLKEKGVVDG